MAIVHIAITSAIAMCSNLVESIDVNGPGKLVIYEGAMPADVEVDITTQRPLVEFTLPNPSFGDPVQTGIGGTATANLIDPVPASLSATVPEPVLFFRIFDGDGLARLDGDVTVGTGNGALKIDALQIVADVNVTILSLTITQRNK